MITKMLSELKDEDLQALLSRDVGITDVLSAVNEIVMEVGSKGDEALFKYTEKFEGARLDDLRVSEEEIDAAYDLVEERLMEALSDAADNIRQFHNLQKERDLWMTEIAPGVSVGQKVVPLDSVGAYVPGGQGLLSQLCFDECYSRQSGRCFQDSSMHSTQSRRVHNSSHPRGCRYGRCR